MVRPSYGVVAEGWPQPRRADGVSDVCSLSIPGGAFGDLYPLARGCQAPRRIFFLLNSPAALAAGRATGWLPKAGRSRGKLMVALRMFSHSTRTREAEPTAPPISFCQ
jgi:hypothetical protein